MNNETAPLSDEQLEKIRLRHWNAPKRSNSYANYGEANEDRISLLCQVDYLTRRAKELEADARRYRWLRDQFELQIEKREREELVCDTGTVASYEKTVDYWCFFVLQEDWRFGRTKKAPQLSFDEVIDAERQDAALQLDGKEKRNG